MANRLYLVDAFTDSAFGGNPAAVVLLEEAAPPSWMQSVATEMNLSETAFVTPAPSAGAMQNLRWFTPGAEVDLCGHATLATAHVLGGSQEFDTKAGVLTCKADGQWIEMDFPADMPKEIDTTDQVLQALNGPKPVTTTRGIYDLLIELQSSDEVRALQPDLDCIARIDVRGVIVTAPAGPDDDADFVSRCFYPAIAVPEDPVTGSAHCTLTSWWAHRLDKLEMVGEQASKRGGRVRVTLRGDRVGLAGQAITISHGELLV